MHASIDGSTLHLSSSIERMDGDDVYSSYSTKRTRKPKKNADVMEKSPQWTKKS